MGFSSYTCNHCNHSILHTGSVDPEINSWMKDVVMLAPNGSRLVTEYDGYEGNYEDFAMNDSVWVHQACWELAGKPDIESYSSPSKSAEDQGHFFSREHDMVDPRLPEGDRERLLNEGIARREQRWFDGRARDVADWMQELSDEKPADPWTLRFTYMEAFVRDAEGKFIKDEATGFFLRDGTWWIFRDNLYPDLPEADRIRRGTEEDMKQHLNSLWVQFVESDECAAYLTRAKELQEESRAQFVEDMKKRGRYTISYNSVKGDVVKKDGERDWVGSRHVYMVHDQTTFAKVATFDGPNNELGVEVFYGEYPQERIQAMRDSMQKSCDLAKEHAHFLNEQWAVDGYPVSF